MSEPSRRLLTEVLSMSLFGTICSFIQKICFSTYLAPGSLLAHEGETKPYPQELTLGLGGGGSGGSGAG